MNQDQQGQNRETWTFTKMVVWFWIGVGVFMCVYTLTPSVSSSYKYVIHWTNPFTGIKTDIKVVEVWQDSREQRIYWKDNAGYYYRIREDGGLDRMNVFEYMLRSREQAFTKQEGKS